MSTSLKEKKEIAAYLHGIVDTIIENMTGCSEIEVEIDRYGDWQDYITGYQDTVGTTHVRIEFFRVKRED